MTFFIYMTLVCIGGGRLASENFICKMFVIIPTSITVALFVLTIIMNLFCRCCVKEV